MKNYYKELMDLALISIGKIEDDVQKVDAISKILPSTFILEEDMENVETSTTPVAEEKETAKPATKRGRKPKKVVEEVVEENTEEEAKEEAVVAKDATTPVVEEEPKDKVETTEPVQEVVKEEEKKVVPEKKPLEMIRPETAKVEEVKEEVEVTYELTDPKIDDTEEEIAARQVAIVKKYGDKTLYEAFSDENISKYLVRELNGIDALKDVIMACFGITTDANGVEHSESGISSDIIDELIRFYIKELEPGVENYTEVKLDKFITKFVPYMKVLYKIYQFDRNQISEGGQAMMDGAAFQPDSINIDNAEALLCVLQEMYHAA